jgi:hypothetical protein
VRGDLRLIPQNAGAHFGDLVLDALHDFLEFGFVSEVFEPGVLLCEQVVAPAGLDGTAKPEVGLVFVSSNGADDCQVVTRVELVVSSCVGAADHNLTTWDLFSAAM